MQNVSENYLQDGVLKVMCDPEKRLKRIPAAALQTFQGALKTLDDVLDPHDSINYNRLRALLEGEGFAAPVFTWYGHDKLLDGYQRLLVCEREEWSIEGGVPVVEIEAADEQEAARKLPHVYIAVYGQVNATRFFDFAQLYDIDIPIFDVPFPDFDIPFPDFDIQLFERGHTEVKRPMAGRR